MAKNNLTGVVITFTDDKMSEIAFGIFKTFFKSIFVMMIFDTAAMGDFC